MLTQETEPNIPARNFVDSYFIAATTDSTLAYTVAPVFLLGLALVLGGVTEGVLEAPRLYDALSGHHFAEAIRSGLAMLGAGAVTGAGLEILKSADYVSNHPNLHSLVDYRDRASARWNEYIRQSR